ncbi:DUF6783 domain-containing protein [Diplocloster agilis]|uniref:DUF6783 domain-containing protein n=1 Tax=Diplocloster agilis TaxID=2850323 RepID=UPI003A7F176D
MKIHSRHLHAPLCGIFGPNSFSAATASPSSEPNLPQSVIHSRQERQKLHSNDNPAR